MLAEVAVRAEGLTRSFGEVRALRGVDLEIPAGTVLGLLGPNGAGKTTTVRILTTLLAPDAGRAEVAGYDVVRQPQAVRRIIGLAGQYAAVEENLTARENLVLVGRLYHLSKREARARTDALLERFGIAYAADRLVKGFSGGMRRRLDLAASLVNAPSVLFLDEPTTGLDPASRLALWEVIRELVAEGTTLLLTTQYLEEADRLADDIVVIDDGAVIAQGTADELKRQAGGDIVELTLVDRTATDEAVAAIRREGAEPSVDHDTGHLVVPAGRGAADLTLVVRALDGAGIEAADISLRRPTLDEVFLAMTGHRARDADAQRVEEVPA